MRRIGTSPLHAAFSTTAAAIVFLAAGTMGYTIKKSNWSVVAWSWSEDVVWWEIRVGVVFLLLAVFFWRKGLRSLNEQSRPQEPL